MRFSTVLILFMILIAFTSCNKTYVCHCNYNLAQYVVEGDVRAKSAADAQKQCESGNGKADNDFTCHLR